MNGIAKRLIPSRRLSMLTSHVKVIQLATEVKTTKIVMGDKSPKANQKQASQKQTKTSSTQQKKQAVTAAKQTPKKK